MKFPYKIIDLTHVLENIMPAWDGGCGFNHDVQMDYSDCHGEDKFRVMKLSMDAGIGTHMDAPSHCITGGKCIDEFDVSDLCMPCMVIDVSSKAHEHYRVSAQDISDFESLYGPIRQGTCVMIKTGWERFWRESLKYHNNHVFPSVSIEAANLLLERGVAALGIDTLSPDCPEYGFKVHQAFLGKGKILIENVANLDNMPPTGAFVMICPLKVRDGTEAPIRLLGLLS
ncbi:cyclase family protein [Legionella rowbothamii]|uniref:cyclase family protein n=1 Tax=Legionella rowbothamii TaxID=96229 RepID=UPI001054C8A2|nr:cyclase family protein [Legionella rowbothamii]